jgi:hypothetical protein
MGVLHSLERLATPSGELVLRRSWPREDGLLHLEYTAPTGARVAAQWTSDPSRRERLAAATPPPATLHESGVLLHLGGADRRLPALPDVLAVPGATLLSHRPERRAVLRTGRDFTKVVRPGRVGALLTAADQAAAAGGGAFRVPRANEVDAERGVVRWQGVAAPTLLECVAAPPEVLARAWGSAGRAVAALHDGSGAGLPTHDAAAECAAAERWTAAAAAWGLLPAAPRHAAYEELLGGTPGPLGVLHRDLHDKQVLVGEQVWLIDLDTLAVGERALDLANALVHLELRVAQGLMTRTAAQVAREAFVAAVAPDPRTVARVSAHERVARLRLAGVYAFRPRWRALALRWHTLALTGPR